MMIHGRICFFNSRYNLLSLEEIKQEFFIKEINLNFKTDKKFKIDI